MKWWSVDQETPRLFAMDPFGSPRQPSLRSGRGQALFGALNNQIPFDLCEETEHGDHHLGLDVLGAVEPNVLLDGHELHTFLDEAVHQLDDLPHTPAQSR